MQTARAEKAADYSEISERPSREATRVISLSPAQDARWDAYVDSHSGGTLFHKTAWRNIVSNTFGYEPRYLYAERGGRITGVLPLFHIRSRFAGNAMISTPFSVYGGVIAESESEARMLLDEATRLAELGKATYIELRERTHVEREGHIIRDSLYCTFVRPIVPDPQENFLLLPKECRRMVRRAQGVEYTGEFVTGQSGLRRFYDIYAASVRNLGTPVFPIELFENCLAELGESADLLLISRKAVPVAGVLSFYYKDTVLPYYGGSIPDLKLPSPNNFMYWLLMKESATRGYSLFDFGRSKANTGAYNFKRHMGFSPEPLHYQYKLLDGGDLPNNNPTNPKYQLAIRAWRRLPLPVTKLLGPRLVRAFP